MTVERHAGPEEYCREIEAYLCRKNDGHLVRIVGPAFEQVCAWAARGVPIKLAFRGIDRYFERYYAKGPRRRPVRVEFCEADVLDVFDEWRRAVGIPAVAEPAASYAPDTLAPGREDRPAGGAGVQADAPSAGRQGSLPSHLDRVIARLTSLRAGPDRSLDAMLDAIVRELDAARASARSLRGEGRAAFVERMRQLDAVLVAAARGRCDAAALARIAGEADDELAPFRERMPREAYDQARSACIDRIVRERFRLPVIAYDG